MGVLKNTAASSARRYDLAQFIGGGATRIETLEVEPTGANDTGPCECCGKNSRCVWGFVHTPEQSGAFYFVHWTLGRIADHGANFDLIIGRWGEGSSARDRVLVALA